MTHQFSQVPKAEIQRSSFDRSHGLKTTFDAGFHVDIIHDGEDGCCHPCKAGHVDVKGVARESLVAEYWNEVTSQSPK